MGFKYTSTEYNTFEEFLENVLVVGAGKETVIMNRDDERPVSLKMVLTNCSVKYKPEKFDKMTVVVNDDVAVKKLNELYNKVFEHCEKFIKSNLFSVKIDKKNIEEINQTLKVGDKVGIKVSFNNVWLFERKLYVSFKLEECIRLKKKIQD